MGSTWQMSWDAALGNLEGASEAFAFVKVLDPSTGFSLTEFATTDMTSIADSWSSFAMSIEIGDWDGQILQFGFLSNASNFEGAGVFYDNVQFSAVPVPGALVLFVSGFLGFAGIRLRRG